jgi:hypothetical protein
VTLEDYIEDTKEKFKNKVYVRVYLKKCLDQFFVLYWDWFVWIVKNAFHKDKFLDGYRPPTVDPTLEKETGRKDIKQFLKNAVMVKQLLKRDATVVEDFVERRRDFFAESYLETLKQNTQLLSRKLFEGGVGEGQKAPVKYLDEATQKLREGFKK